MRPHALTSSAVRQTLPIAIDASEIPSNILIYMFYFQHGKRTITWLWTLDNYCALKIMIIARESFVNRSQSRVQRSAVLAIAVFLAEKRADLDIMETNIIILANQFSTEHGGAILLVIAIASHN